MSCETGSTCHKRGAREIRCYFLHSLQVAGAVAGVLKVSHDAFISSLASHLIFRQNLG